MMCMNMILKYKNVFKRIEMTINDYNACINDY